VLAYCMRMYSAKAGGLRFLNYTTNDLLEREGEFSVFPLACPPPRLLLGKRAGGFYFALFLRDIKWVRLKIAESPAQID